MSKKDITKKKKNEIIREAQIDDDNRFKKMQFFKIVIGVLLIVAAVISAFVTINKKDNNDESGTADFKAEYEQYNGKTTDSGKDYLEVKVDTNVNIKYTDYEEIFDLLENGTAVIYFGFPTCPWCRNLVPVLLDSAEEAGIDKIYYINNLEDRDTKTLIDGEIVTEKEGTDNYNKLVNKLYNVLGEYSGLEDSSIKRLYFPTVVFVKDGEVVDIQISTVSTQKDPYIALTDSEYSELKETLTNKMLKTIVCDDAC